LRERQRKRGDRGLRGREVGWEGVAYDGLFYDLGPCDAMMGMDVGCVVSINQSTVQ